MRVPRVSVIIPAYDRARETAEAAASVLTQSVPELELIVVDDGSKERLAESLGCRDSRLRVLRLEANQGPARARNAGIAAARADLIAFLDSDDLWTPRKLEIQLERFQDPSAAWSYGEIEARVGQAVVTSAYTKSRELYLDSFWDGRSVAVCSTIVARRSCLAAIGGFDGHFRTSCVEDLDFVLRLERRCGAGRFHPEPLAIKRGAAAIAGHVREDATPERLLDQARFRILRERGVYG